MDGGSDHMSARDAFARAMETLRQQAPERASTSVEQSSVKEGDGARAAETFKKAGDQLNPHVADVEAGKRSARSELRKEWIDQYSAVLSDPRPLTDDAKKRELAELLQRVETMDAEDRGA